MVRPNGLAFSPDEKIFTSPIPAPRIRRTARATFAASPSEGGQAVWRRGLRQSTAGLFDGFRIHRQGRIWTSSAEGVHCYDPDGTLIGKIRIPEMVANVTFGGTKLNRLFICGTTSLYSMYVTANGSKLG